MNAPLKLILHTISLLAVFVVNYLTNSGVISNKTVGEVSRKYDSLLTPAGYAFSIWGFIYLLLTVFVVYQWYDYFKNRRSEILEKSGIWFILANFANICWILAWVNNLIGPSVIIMLILLLSLIMLTIKLNLERWDAPLSIISMVWWPITFYLGWIILATVANISAYLVSIGWNGGIIQPQIWAVILIIVSTIIYLFLTFSRNMREASLVGIWGLVAIAVKQWDHNTEVTITALFAAGVLLLTSIYHAYKNRASSPKNKIKNS